jgi:hypothetical protein
VKTSPVYTLLIDIKSIKGTILDDVDKKRERRSQSCIAASRPKSTKCPMRLDDAVDVRRGNGGKVRVLAKNNVFILLSKSFFLK